MHDTVETILKELLTSMGLTGATVARAEAAGQMIFSIVTNDAAEARALIGGHGDANLQSGAGYFSGGGR